MPLPIKNNKKNKQQHFIKGVILGASGIGKTSLLRTINCEKALFIDLEGGDLSIQDLSVDKLEPKTWKGAKELACLIGGANKTNKTGDYSTKQYKDLCDKFGDVSELDKYDTIFIDSLTVLNRLAFKFCKQHPDCITRSGNFDARTAYMLLGDEMTDHLQHYQHLKNKNVWLVGILDKKTDENKTICYEPQMTGSIGRLALSGIFDEVISMVEVPDKRKGAKKGDKQRVFVCQTLNPNGYPAKDRSGKLNMYEPAHLGNLMKKIRGEIVDPVDEGEDFEPIEEQKETKKEIENEEKI